MIVFLLSLWLLSRGGFVLRSTRTVAAANVCDDLAFHKQAYAASSQVEEGFPGLNFDVHIPILHSVAALPSHGCVRTSPAAWWTSVYQKGEPMPFGAMNGCF